MAKELKKNKAQMVMPESKEDKKKALESAIAHILKTYGSGAVMRLGQANTMQVDAIPTGSCSRYRWRSTGQNRRIVWSGKFR